MEHLRDRVADVAALIPRGKPVVYLDYPIHTNIGDLLIETATETFFARLGYNVVCQRSVYDFGPRVMRRVPADATIVLHGGGNFGDLYDLHQPFREQVIASFPNHRIVLLPQTMHFDSIERLRKAAAIFARHPDLHVCLRDTVSLELYRRHFVNPAYLVPDMAHFLWGSMDAEPLARGGKGTLVLVRRDREEQPMAGPSPDGGHVCDWWDLIRPSELFTFRVLRKLHATHHVVGGRLPMHWLWQAYIGHLIRKTVRFVAAHDSVMTNRLHAAIFGLLLGRPVTMSDNSYGKLSSYYATWLTEILDVRLAVPEAELRWRDDRLKVSAGDG